MILALPAIINTAQTKGFMSKNKYADLRLKWVDESGDGKCAFVRKAKRRSSAPKFDLNRLKYEAVMDMLFNWRNREINAAAILLGIREGDTLLAQEEADQYLNRIRIWVDDKKGVYKGLPKSSAAKLPRKPAR